MPVRPEDLLELSPEEAAQVAVLEALIDTSLRERWRPGAAVSVPMGETTWRVIQRIMADYRILNWQVNPTNMPIDGIHELEFREKPQREDYKGRTDWP